MSNATIQLRVTEELKNEAEAIFIAMGMSTPDAIRIFLQHCVNAGGLPFQPTAIKRPNAKTAAAMQELEAGKGKKFKNSEEFFDDLGI